MREAPSEPVLHLCHRPIHCAGCPDTEPEITRGWRFDGSDAVFCDACMHFIQHVRSKLGGAKELRICHTCGDQFEELVTRESRVNCPRCRREHWEQRHQLRGTILDLFELEAQKVM